jgi:cytoskeletal protein RodZ
LECGRYEKLPVQAYVRGYLNTICTRLELNRAKVLDWYAGEVGRDYSAKILTDLAPESNSLSHSHSAHVKMITPSASDRGSMGKVIVGVVVVVAVALLVIMKSNHKQEQEAQIASRLADSLDSVKVVKAHADSVAAAETLSTTDTSGLSGDSADVAAKPNDSTATESEKDKKAEVAADKKQDKDSKKGKAEVAAPEETTLKFECIKDSTWVRVNRVGGLKWVHKVHHTDKARFVSHNDTMKVTIGAPEKARLYINDEAVKIPGNYFKVYNGKIIPKD